MSTSYFILAVSDKRNVKIPVAVIAPPLLGHSIAVSGDAEPSPLNLDCHPLFEKIALLVVTEPFVCRWALVASLFSCANLPLSAMLTEIDRLAKTEL